MSTIDTPRKLNMDEKRKLEKLLLSDIEKAEREYRSKRTEEYSVLKDKIEKTPPKEVAALFRKRQAASQTISEMDGALKRLGWDIGSYPKSHARVATPSKIPTLCAHSEETASANRYFESMKRSYILKLFAGGEEAQSLFAVLAEELKAITK